MGFSFGEPVAPLTPPLSPEFSRRSPVPPKLQGRSAQAMRDADSDEYDEDDEDVAMREYHGRRAPRPKESLLDLLNSAPPGWTEPAGLEDPPPSPSFSTGARSAKSSKSARFLPSSLRGFKARGSARNAAVGSEALRASKSSHDLRPLAGKGKSAAAGEFAHELPPLPAAPAPKLATKEAVRARGSSTADLASFLRSSGPSQPMAPVSEFGAVPSAVSSASANPRRRSQTLNGLGIRDRPQSTSTYGTMLENYYSTVTHEAPVSQPRSGDSSDGCEEIAAPPANSPPRPRGPPGPLALHRENSTGAQSWHTTHSSATEHRVPGPQINYSPVAAPRYTRGRGSVPVLTRQGSLTSVRSLGGGGLSPTSSRRLSRKPPPSPTEHDLNVSQSSVSTSGERGVISASTMAALQQLQQHSPHPKSPTPVIAEEPDLTAPMATPRQARGSSTTETTQTRSTSTPVVVPIPVPTFVPTHQAAQSSMDLATTNLAAQFSRPTSIYLNSLSITSDPTRLPLQLDDAERALLRSRPTSPPPDEPLPAPPLAPITAVMGRPPRESSLPRQASLSAESARLLSANGPTSKADKRKSTMRVSAYGAAELAFSSPAPSMDSFQSSVVDPPLASVANAGVVPRPAALTNALAALQAAMQGTAVMGLGEEGDALAATLPFLRSLQGQFSLAANLIGEVIAASGMEATADIRGIHNLQARGDSPERDTQPTEIGLHGASSPLGRLPYDGVSELSDHTESELEEEEDPETDVLIERAEVVVRTPTTPNLQVNDGYAF